MKILLDSQLQKILDRAWTDAKTRRHEFLTPEHLLLSLIDFSPVAELLEKAGVNVFAVRKDIDAYLRENVSIVAENMDPIQTVGFQNIFRRAAVFCNNAEKAVMDAGDVLVSVFEEDKNHCSWILKKAGLERLALIEGIASGDLSVSDPDNGSGTDASSMEGEGPSAPGESAGNKPGFFSSGRGKTVLDRWELREGGRDNYSDKNRAPQSGGDFSEAHATSSHRSFLDRFTENLTAKAARGQLDPVVGRNEEIDLTIQALCCRMKNNPIHVGETGVGKTSVTEGLAQRIAEGNVPEKLKHAVIYKLDVASLLAGTKFRGDFEERVKKLTDELIKREASILFIDEIHMLVGAGAGGGNGTVDASNLLKPVLASGKIRCIGSTTYDEYSKYFEKDRAFARRFQKIDILEPSEEETVSILRGLKDRYEAFHHVEYTAEAIDAAVRLSALYVNDRFLPDKAIDVLDEAGARLRIAEGAVDFNKPLPKVTVPLIETVVAKIARIPEKSIGADENKKLQTLQENLAENIFGQDDAVRELSRTVKRARAGFRSGSKPGVCFLFAGPTGVGKTEMARQLAEILGLPLIRFDMSEYQEKHTVSRLIGSPPGYVGFEDGGLLTDAIRKQPRSVLLLDEIEKAHQDIFNVLLQVMDYATLTDNQGRKADFRNVLLIMTSNAGADQIGKPAIGFGGSEMSDEALDEAVKKAFSPEFRNRLDAVIKFTRLSKEVVESIVRKEIALIGRRLEEKNVFLSVSKNAVAFLAEKAYSPEFGARNVARIVEDEIAAPLVDDVLFGRLAAGGTVVFSVKNGKIAFSVKAGAQPHTVVSPALASSGPLEPAEQERADEKNGAVDFPEYAAAPAEIQ